MAQPSWKHNDNLFFKELKEGHSWQSLPALFFQLHGLKVEMPNLSIRNDISEASKWKDTFDLLVENYPLEVKSRNEFFTTPLDFPYDTTIVDTKSGYDSKKEKPIAYIMISKPTGCMLCLKSTSSNKWQTTEKFDNIRKIKDTFYVCDKKRLQPISSLLQFFKDNVRC